MVCFQDSYKFISEGSFSELFFFVLYSNLRYALSYYPIGSYIYQLDWNQQYLILHLCLCWKASPQMN